METRAVEMGEGLRDESEGVKRLLTTLGWRWKAESDRVKEMKKWRWSAGW